MAHVAGAGWRRETGEWARRTGHAAAPVDTPAIQRPVKVQQQPPEPRVFGRNAAVVRSGPAAPAAGWRRETGDWTGELISQKSDTLEVRVQFYKQTMGKLKYQALSKRIRFRDFFLDFDTLRSGSVSEAHFRSALGMTGIHFDEAELLALLEKFRKPDVPDRINYDRLCRSLEKVHVTPGLEKAPLKPVRPVGDAVPRPAELRLADEEETAYVRAIIERFRKRSEDRRLVALETFWRGTGGHSVFNRPAFDKLRKGFVTRAQFLRGLQLLDEKWVSASPQELEAICNFYSCNNGLDVNYLRFCEDVTPRDTSAKQYKTARDMDSFANHSRADTSARGLTADQVEDYIMTRVFEERIRVRDFFRDFDKLRSHYCSERAFQSALSMAKIDLNQAQLNALFAKYRTRPNNTQSVHYEAFLASIERVDTVRELEKDPQREFDTLAPKQTPVRPTTTVLQPRDVEETNRVIARICEQMHRRRLDIRPAFVEEDRVHHHMGRVTRWRFRQILALHKIELTDAEFALLAAKYGKDEYIDYYLFLDDAKLRDDASLRFNETKEKFVQVRGQAPEGRFVPSRAQAL